MRYVLYQDGVEFKSFAKKAEAEDFAEEMITKAMEDDSLDQRIYWDWWTKRPNNHHYVLEQRW